MRPYRAIPIDGKDFVYGWYIRTDFAHYIVPAKYTVNWKVFIEVIPESVGQQVGRKDKNDKEIYAGDISLYKIYMTAKQKFPVRTMVWIWSEYHYGFVMKDIFEDRYEAPIMIPSEHEITIIGNKHQHPELLE